MVDLWVARKGLWNEAQHLTFTLESATIFCLLEVTETALTLLPGLFQQDGLLLFGWLVSHLTE